MRSCRRLNARNIVFRVIEEWRGKKEKKREKKGVKKCIRRYPDYSIHGQSPAFRSDSHDRGMKKRSWKLFRPSADCFLIFSNSLGGKRLPDSLSLFDVSHEKLPKFIDCFG